MPKDPEGVQKVTVEDPFKNVLPKGPEWGSMTLRQPDSNRVPRVGLLRYILHLPGLRFLGQNLSWLGNSGTYKTVSIRERTESLNSTSTFYD